MRTPLLTFILLTLVASCRSVPWSSASVESINLAVAIENNLLVSSETVGGRPARVVFASAHSQTILDDQFAQGLTPSVSVELGDRRSAEIRPLVHDLAGVADVLVGMDVWRGRAVTFDYERKMISISAAQTKGSDDFTTFGFEVTPAIPLIVDGVRYIAIVDVASPDSIILPKGNQTEGRREVSVMLGPDRFEIDALFRDVAHARIGARLLSRYLLRIDYGKREVGLWRRR